MPDYKKNRAPDAYGQRILKSLVDSYEKSVLSRGENKVSVHIAYPFTKKNVPEYFDESSLAYEDIHACLKEYEQKGFVSVVWKNNKEGHIIRKVLLEEENIQDVYRYLHRIPKSESEKKILRLLDETGEIYRTPVISAFVDYLQERIRQGKPVKEFIRIEKPEETGRLLRAVAMIEENISECYIREFSVKSLNDSKALEGMLGTVAKVFRKFAPEFSGMDAQGILAEYSIYHTPNYVYFKGEGILRFPAGEAFREGVTDSPAGNISQEGVTDPPAGNISQEGVTDFSAGNISREGVMDFPADGHPGETVIDLRMLRQGIGLSGEDLEKVRFEGSASIKRVITIENLTTFFRWAEPGSIMIYLGGYHNSLRRRLLRKIHSEMPDAEYLHFGDIDVGGFVIYEDLCAKTGIRFLPYHMGAEELIRYGQYARKLTENDRKRLSEFIGEKRGTDCIYMEALEFMEKQGIKLEQECVGQEEKDKSAFL